MNEAFYLKIAKSTAHRAIRDQNTELVILNPGLFPDLLSLALSTDDKNHHKACWTLELVIDQKIEWLLPHLDEFCQTLCNFRHDGAIRSISKICWLAAAYHQKHPQKKFLAPRHVKLLTEVCFNWVIGDDKVAAKAYSIRALYELGKTEQWVYPELIPVLHQGFPNHTAAYKAVAREILAKINR